MNGTPNNVTSDNSVSSEYSASEKTFSESQIYQPGVPEWKVLFILALHGPQNRYEIAENYGLRAHLAYPSVFGAVKKLQKMGWVEPLERYRSEKNLQISKYSLTVEGLLWVISRIPKYTELSDESVPEISEIDTQEDVHLFFILAFNPETALEKTNLIPLALNYRNPQPRAGEQEFVSWQVADVAFSALHEYYFGYEGLRDKLKTLSLIFAYKLYEQRLRHLDCYYDPVMNKLRPDLKKSLLTAIVVGCKSDPQVRLFIHDILKEIEEEATLQQKIMKDIRRALGQADIKST